MSRGKHFSRDLRPLDEDGAQKSMWASDKDEESSEEESSEEESSDSDGPSQPVSAGLGNTELTREERRAQQKAKKAAAIARKNTPAQPGDLPPSDSEEESDDADMPANPNHTAKARAQTAKPVVAADPEAAPPKKKVQDAGSLSRREREALQAQQAKERYQKLQAEGKTDQARADLERLKLVRQKREEEAARKEAERQEREEHEKAKGEQMAREERMRAQAAGKKARGGKKK
ncbi:hypothetical protein CAC42_1046 [Sphaceloma murrayae]|uniref:Casein kinase substrate phosphoprotein PP28 domain-containing protein n=1 Tax=Sphaceloma murrayae TaxID=2082308 RepID=A0A2K1R1V2_9PEZI|nr:hypothetical protein CAC42_1046 [Sphaceloma murrayae]